MTIADGFKTFLSSHLTVWLPNGQSNNKSGEGFKIGVVTGSVATLVFTFFFLFYATEISPTFLTSLLENIKWNFQSNIGLVVFIVAIMGLSTTVVSALTVMQLFKKSNNYVENK